MMMYDLSIFRFKWNTLKLPEDFSIAPATGYCSPGMDVNFVVSFRPTRHDSLIEGDVSVYNFYRCTCAHKYSIFDESLVFSVYTKHKSGLLRNTVISRLSHISRHISTSYLTFRNNFSPRNLRTGLSHA